MVGAQGPKLRMSAFKSPPVQNSEVENLSWFHPHADRHVAETLLLKNGQDGAYLLRRRDKQGEFALSVRCRDAVKHFPVHWNGSVYKFGLATFANLQDFSNHFDNRPLVGGESGVLTVLTTPYPNTVEEPTGIYDNVRIHAEFGRTPSAKDTTRFEAPPMANASKSGYLTKQGGRVKNWKTRWFSLLQNELKYYKHNTDKEPIRNLDLRDCTCCEYDTSEDKENCFKLEFSWRTFYMYAATEQDTREWVELLKWKVKKNKERRK